MTMMPLLTKRLKGGVSHNNYLNLRRIEQGPPAPPAGTNKGPTLGLAGNAGQKLQVKAKVFALNREELGVDAAIVEGTFTIHGCSVTALIDPGSTCSFINKTCACYLDWVGEELPYVLHVSTPWERTAVANNYVLDQKIQVRRKVLKANLIVMPIEDYDLILGMYWLSKHGARVDYKNKVVQFVKPQKEVIEFKGNRIKERKFLIAEAKARKMLRKGC
jgi:hypothetical protein